MSGLTRVRQELAAHLAAAGLPCTDRIPTVLAGPVVLVVPGEPWLDRRRTPAAWDLSWRVAVVVPGLASLPAITAQIESLVLACLEALPATVRVSKVDAPTGDTGLGDTTGWRTDIHITQTIAIT